MITSTSRATATAATVGAFAAAACSLVLASGAGAATTWLCKPGMPGSACAVSQKTTSVSSTGRRTVSTPTVPKSPKVDCFYVYPTTSDEKQPAADFAITPELKAIALNQAAPYSQACKVYAPVYRQVTLQGLLNPSTVTTEMRQTAYADVVAAWRDYLSHYNRGRGVILVGHSQGTFVLRRLVSQEIDPKPTVLKKLVAAHLTGGNVLVAKGSDRGGDFKNVPSCKSTRQVGCVVAYSAFNSAVPTDTLFGRAAATAWDPTADPATREVLCTNPAKLSGGSGNLISRNSTAPFPGTIGLVIGLLGRLLPTGLTTPWVSQDYLYSARCETSNGANVLMVTSRTGQAPLTPSPSATWGLHLADMNIAMGNLIALAKSESAAWK